ncbi:MAG: helix-turn-helix domain-containing protein [Actinomycetota bacterium]
MDAAHLEFLVEPFVIDEPGSHVLAAVDVARDAGLDPDMGPFATSATGSIDDVIDAVADLLRASFADGASSVQLRVDLGDRAPKPGLHDALDRMIADVEREIGAELVAMSRAQKQEAAARLEAQGAFLLRGSAEALAARMSISKVTLYAYLNALDRS